MINTANTTHLTSYRRNVRPLTTSLLSPLITPSLKLPSRVVEYKKNTYLLSLSLSLVVVVAVVVVVVVVVCIFLYVTKREVKKKEPV
jgi:heme/copper-type cytochrome/quinol oxidase subunit 2